jgi:hypothetical protein
MRPDVELRRASGGFWTVEMPRRRSGRHGGLENLVGVVNYFQREARKAAGGGTDVGGSGGG